MIVVKEFKINGIVACYFVVHGDTANSSDYCPVMLPIFNKYCSNSSKWFLNHYPCCEACVIDE